MSDDAEVVDGEVAAMADAAAEVEDFMPTGTDLAVADPSDQHEVAIVMDAHDVELLLSRVQGSALKKWVYRLPDGQEGLTVSAVQDVTQLMNWMGKTRLTVDSGSLTVDRIVEDMGNGPEPLWVATVFARDLVTDAAFPGTSMEPVMMRLTEKTANKWRDKGKIVPEDRRVFDVFSRTKAINKAYRNALAAFIPEVVEQTIIAMYANDPSRVEMISTPEEQKAAEMPAPLETPEALALAAECDDLYEQIKAISPEARVRFTPAQYHAWMMRSHHDMGRLEAFKEHLLQRLGEMPGEIENDRIAREAHDTALETVCPLCLQGKSWRCKQLDREGAPVLRNEKPVLMNVPHADRVQARAAELR